MNYIPNNTTDKSTQTNMKKNYSFYYRALRWGVAALLLLVTSVAANAYDFEVDGIYYRIKGSNVYVTYKYMNGLDYDSRYDSFPDLCSSDYTGSVVIPDSVTYDEITYAVTAIDSYAFEYCSGLTSVTIPEGVTEIGHYAFYYCTGLTEVIIPNSVTSIGGCAFRNCSSLTDITIPDSLTTINDSMLDGCSSLTGELLIPDGVTSIGRYAFYRCSGLTEIAIPDRVTSIGIGAFWNCSGLMGELIIPDRVTSIGEYVFCGCSGLTSITIPNSVTSIGSSAFASCTGLTEITIPNSVTEIGNRAFQRCTGLTSVTIGESVTTIGEEAFYICSGLTSVTIGESVTSIGGDAFGDCTGLTSIYSLNPEPPTCSSRLSVFGVFNKVDTSTCTLYVPEGTKEAYSAADQWKDFLNIVDNQPNAIDDILIKGNAEAEGYYTTDGKQVPTPQRGINIVRYSDGSSKKVLVK